MASRGKGETPIARGQSQASDTQRQQINQIAGGQYGQAQTLENQLIPQYTSMLNEGYTPQQQSAMTTSGMGAIGSSIDAAKQQTRNDAAQTNNAAGLYENQDKLALQGGVAQGNEAAGLQQSFADTQMANQKAGLAGLSGLYGSNLSAGTSLYGLDPGLLQARAAGQNPLLGLAQSTIGAAGAALGGSSNSGG